ncbi:enoyl-CoA hydratase/isomerase family protein [Ottowia thiooxydans]|uniref:Enoyl-CoA hydratase n=1 Tax=Ottowia thiooxydans TaxID=219182 RepID=A0ABV2Q1M2_9BURK
MNNESFASVMDFSHIQFETHGHVAVVRMNRPPVNAQNTTMRQELIRAFDTINDMVDVRCVILTGSGDKFSAGADLRERDHFKEAGSYWAHNRNAREVGNAINECSRPVIAAINGPAIGAGFGLVMHCDIWIASNEAWISMPEIKVGLAGGTASLQRVFGKSRARRMIYTGMRVSANELYRLGLIEASVPRDKLMDEAMAIANEVAENSPTAVRMAKESARVTTLMPQRDAYRFEQNMTVALSRTEDAREARMAFLENRRPLFRGC